MNECPALPKKVAMLRPCRHILAALLVALLAVLVPAPPGLAQFGLGHTAQNPDDPQMMAEIGWAGAAWPNRWVPVTITLTGGAKAFDGAVAMTYSQDDRTAAQIIRQVAATPGKVSTYTLLANLPASCGHAVLSLRTKGGREIRRIVFDAIPDTERGEVSLPMAHALSPIVLAVGEPGGVSFSLARALQSDAENRSALGVARPSCGFVPVSSIAPSWAALDSVLLMIADADAARGSDPRIMAAIREWVSSGGRLVVLAGGPGNGWRDWLVPSPESAAPVEIAPTRTMELPEDLAGALAVAPPQVADTTPQQAAAATQTVTPPPPSPPAPDQRFSAAASIASRPISLTAAGRALGWTVRYAASEEPELGMVAAGPLGFGWVTVIGFDPQHVASTVQRDATGRVLYRLLDATLADWRARPAANAPAGYMFGYGYNTFSSGSLYFTDAQTELSRRTVLDSIADVPTASNTVFPILAAGMVVLALLLGPVDALVLRRLGARHRSWATAIGWISLASAAAYLIPNVARSGNTRVNRVSVVDAIQATPDSAGPSPAWCTGVTGVFAGSSLVQPFGGRLAGTWWKSAAGVEQDYWNNREGPAPRRSLTTLQSLPDLSTIARTDDPWGGFGTSQDGTGGNIPTPIPFKLWTFRTFEDQGRTSTPLHAVVRRAGGSLAVSLRGVPSGARVASAALRTFDDGVPVWRTLAFQPTSDGLEVPKVDAGTLRAPSEWAAPNAERAANFYGRSLAISGTRGCGHALLLPGPDRRGQVIDAALRRGNAVLYLLLTDMPADVTLKADAEYKHTQVCRLVVPITGDEPAASEPQEGAK
jgi:hypothetical protein